MNKKTNKRFLGMTQTELLILVTMGGLLLCVLALFGGYIIYDLNRSNPVAVLPPTLMPQSIIQPTIQPTNSPLPVKPLDTLIPQLTDTPLPSATPIPPTIKPKPIGTLRVNNWLFEITAVHSDPGMDSSRQQVVLLGNITNEGGSTDGFVAYAKLILRDSQGRQYEDDRVGTFSAMDKYGTQIPAGINPGATILYAVAFETPSSERTFTIIPGALVASWSGDITFTLP
jgi:hypothetical protein